MFFVDLAREILAPEVFECHYIPQPFAAQQSPKQAVFIARVLSTRILWPRTTSPPQQGYPRRYWALAVVQKSYWGLPWWDHKIVVLTFFVRGGSGFEWGAVYFVDGKPRRRGLTQFLPFFETHCTRTGALKYSEVDLRALRDGAPKNSVRHHGIHLSAEVHRRMEGSAWNECWNLWSRRQTVVTSDQQGCMKWLRIDSWIVFRSWDQEPQGAYGSSWAHGISIGMGLNPSNQGTFVSVALLSAKLSWEKESGCAWEVVLSDMWFCQDFSGNGVCT